MIRYIQVEFITLVNVISLLLLLDIALLHDLIETSKVINIDCKTVCYHHSYCCLLPDAYLTFLHFSLFLNFYVIILYYANIQIMCTLLCNIICTYSNTL